MWILVFLFCEVHSFTVSAASKAFFCYIIFSNFQNLLKGAYQFAQRKDFKREKYCISINLMNMQKSSNTSNSDCCLKSILGWQEKLFQISKRLASRIPGSISTTMKLNVFPVLLSKIKLNYQQNVHLLQIWVIIPIDLCNHFYQISLLYFVTDNRKGCNACSFTRDWQKVANNNNVSCFNDMRFFANGAYVQRKNSQLSGNPLLMLHTFQIIRIRISTCLNVKRVDIWCMLSRSNWKGEEFFWRKWLCYGLCL